MLYLLAVVTVAAKLGRGPAVLASFVSVGLFDFFLVPPQWSFAVSDVQYLLTFTVMLGVALLISHLTTGLQQRADAARQTAQRANALASLARNLASALTAPDIQLAVAGFLQKELQVTALLLVPDDAENLQPMGPSAIRLTPTLLMASRAACGSQHSLQADQLADHDEALALFPLRGATRTRGVMVVSDPTGHRSHLQVQTPLLDAVALLVATSLERIHFVDVAHRTQLDMASERLRSAILQALSHDIRTPLTALCGLADSLSLTSPATQSEIVDAIRDQALRLHDMVSKLLDMARLQSGQHLGHVTLRREWQPIEEVIGASIQTLGQALKAHPVRVHLPPDTPLVHIDAVLMERVFGNLLDNASRYAPPGTDIHVHATPEGGWLQLRVCNAGAGFPPNRLETVFGLFERGQPESSVPGIGLGLAICKAIVQAHGGEISAHNPAQGGAEVRFSLPLGQPPEIDVDDGLATAPTAALPSPPNRITP